VPSFIVLVDARVTVEGAFFQSGCVMLFLKPRVPEVSTPRMVPLGIWSMVKRKPLLGMRTQGLVQLALV
jgi:hypothetical protein